MSPEIERRAGRRNLKAAPTQSILEEFHGRVTIDLGGAAGPVILTRELKKNEAHIIIDALSQSYDYGGAGKALKKKGVSLFKHFFSAKDPLPMRDSTVDHIDCRHVYEWGHFIDMKHLAKESKRVLKNNGTITISGKIEDKEEVLRHFQNRGFIVEDEIEKPETPFEKGEHSLGMSIHEGAKRALETLEEQVKEGVAKKEGVYYRTSKRLAQEEADMFKEGGVFKIRLRKS
ncbi:MAG: methyltransferase domain-containing protein [Candidatus Diapherotrites archaeon]|nr:methyltransferase domain-containing protein [Candidatus Diapherotrites archaeon]